MGGLMSERIIGIMSERDELQNCSMTIPIG